MGSQRKRKLPLDAKDATAGDTQRELYLAEISHVRTRLLTTLDALDALQTQHAQELQTLTEECIKYLRQANVYKRLWREAEAEKADMRDVVGKLVEKVEQCNDYSQWPYSRLRVASYAAPAFRPSSPSPMPSLPSQTSSSTHPNLYAASLIAALRRDLHAEKSAHRETRHRLTLHISTLEAQLAFREAELEGCTARIGSGLAIADSRCRSCQRLLKADAAVHQQGADTNKPSGVSNGVNYHYDCNAPDTVLRVLDAARVKSRSLEQDIKDITAKLERSRLSTSTSTVNASLRSSMSESRSKAVQTDPTHPGRFHTLAVGDVFEATLRIIEEKLDRSLLDADLGNGGVQNINIQQPSVALPTGAAGLHLGNEETDEDATLRPTPLLPLSHVPAGAAVSTAPAVLLPTIVTPTVQPPSPPIAVSPPSNGVSTGLEDEVPADTDTEVGGTRLAEEFEREVEALGRGVDALRQESGALLNGLRVVDTCHSPMRSPSQPHGQPHQHEHEQEKKLSTDLLDPDDDYGEISMELATPLHPTVTLPLPPSPSLPPSSPHTALLASFPPLPFSPPPASPSPIPSMSPSPPPILPPNTVIRATSTGMAPAPMPLSMPSPSERAPNPLISLATSAPHAPPALPTSTSPFLPSTPHPSPPSRPTATQQRMVSPLTSVFRSPSIKRSPNHSTELDDLQDRHPSGLPGVPGLPPIPPIRRDLDLDYPYAPHREDSSSRSRSVSPLRLSPPLDSAASVTSAVADVLGRDSSPPASPSLLSLASATSPVNVSLPPYADTGYTFQHFQRVEAELREMREALEADEAERVALQGVLDGLVQDVVNGVFGGDGTGERG
ncbi:hypothetical protein CCMSSC00406_0009688 [Pleurotus cornucopiae]|uniref:Uncharacterized protein n=1 Tax=Pleurotus cornucopiae TaxID=5321 RepID=A0ACB7J0W2_PLECO|nr:hypothetical protein CCMSSC00406_0009688 [Pleurotus cornucopiae]